MYAVGSKRVGRKNAPTGVLRAVARPQRTDPHRYMLFVFLPVDVLLLPVQRAHEHLLFVSSGPVNTSPDMVRAIRAGHDTITTDDVTLLVKVQFRHSPHLLIQPAVQHQERDVPSRRCFHTVRSQSAELLCCCGGPRMWHRQSRGCARASGRERGVHRPAPSRDNADSRLRTGILNGYDIDRAGGVDAHGDRRERDLARARKTVYFPAVVAVVILLCLG